MTLDVLTDYTLDINALKDRVSSLERILNSLPLKICEFDVSTLDISYSNKYMEEDPLDFKSLKEIASCKDYNERNMFNPCNFKMQIGDKMIVAQSAVDYLSRLKMVTDFTPCLVYEFDPNNMKLLFFNDIAKQWIKKHKCHDAKIGDDLKLFTSQRFRNCLMDKVSLLGKTNKYLDYVQDLPWVIKNYCIDLDSTRWAPKKSH
jgi:hypothetical protein